MPQQQAARSSSSLHLLHSPQTASSSVLLPCAGLTLSTCSTAPPCAGPSSSCFSSTVGPFSASAVAAGKAAFFLSLAFSRVDDLTSVSPLSMVVSAPSAPSVFALCPLLGVSCRWELVVGGVVVGALVLVLALCLLQHLRMFGAPGSVNSCHDTVQLPDPGRRRRPRDFACLSGGQLRPTDMAMAARSATRHRARRNPDELTRKIAC